MAPDILKKYRTAVASTDPITYGGTVSKSIGILIESRGPLVGVGELCRIQVGEPAGSGGAG